MSDLAERMAAILAEAEAEWEGWTVDAGARICPSCHWEVHAPDCKLAAIVAEARDAGLLPADAVPEVT